MNSDRDPIAAIATAPGRGGIGVVRVSGAELAPVIEGLLGPAANKLEPRRALYAAFLDAAGQPLDRGLALLFPAPRSYTGETVLELQGHGGPVGLQLLLARCLEAGRALGLRLAEPGEFTRRAFLNDRIDLAQAEAVADLIDAATGAAARSAARSLAGEFSVAVEALARELTELRALIEATLDFPEEEIDPLHIADVRGRLDAIAARLERIERRAHQGALLREGLNVVLVGAPNVGKSSLLNQLAGEDVAIVTPIAGTTRDRIAQAIQVHGIPVNAIDTAGLRPTEDEVERLGIARTLAEIERADVVLHLVDATALVGDEDLLAQVRARAAPGVPLLTVFNKIDLIGETPRTQGERVWLSAKTGAGLEGLQDALAAAAGWQRDTAAETVFLARARHLQALAATREHVARAQALGAGGQATAQPELVAEELRLGAAALGAITGAVGADELLGEIFGRFCIGK